MKQYSKQINPTENTGNKKRLVSHSKLHRSANICLAYEYFIIFNNRKMTEFKGLYDEKKKKKKTL